MKNLILSLLLLFALPISAQINQYGIPFIKNYTTKDYNAYSQNWAAVQDQNGIMYFANNNGLLQYDGVNWRIVPISNGAIVKSLFIDSTQKIYVGAENEFGFIQPQKNGKPVYKSLKDKFKINDDFTSISNIYKINNYIYFCAFKKVFTYKNDSINVISLPKGGFFTFKVYNNLYMSEFYNGLMVLKGNKFEPLINGQFSIEKDIMSIIKYDDNSILLISAKNGIYIYNLKTNKLVQKINLNIKKLNSIISDGYLYKAFRKNKDYTFATLYGGIIQTDSAFNIKEIYNYKYGLGDKLVLNIFKNCINNYSSCLWANLNNGISKIENQSSFRQFSEKYKIKHEVYDITEYKNKLYLATSNGVFYLTQINDSILVNQILQTKDLQCWNFAKSNTNLIASSYDLQKLNYPQKVIKSNNSSGIFVLSSQKNKNLVFVGEQKGLSIFESTKDNVIHKTNIPNLQDYIDNITEDHLGNLWLTTNNYDLINVVFNEKDTTINRFENDTLLGKYNNLFTFIIENEVYVSTSNELYKLDTISYKLKIEQDFPAHVHKALTSLSHFKIDFKGNFWVVKLIGNKNQILQIVKNKRAYEIISTPFKRIKDKIILSIYPDSKGIVWIGTPDGLFTYNTNVEVDYTTPYKTLIRKITTKNDSILSYGIDPKSERAKEVIELPYELNTVKFHYAAPFFVEEKETKYMTWLEGNEEDWSNPTKITFKEYNNLHEGTYTFKVKAINIYDIESEMATFTIRILAPWYRTFVAYALYFILLVILVYIIVKLNVRRLEKDKERLEGIVEERTSEIKKQKEDIEAIAEYLKVANNEINEQNEQLGKQKKVIEDKNKHITDSIEYASRIQMALLPPQTLIESYIPDHFILFKPRDIVSGDYYWFKQVGHYSIYATADCTGHGVPGAFMSMLGIAFLNELVTDNEKHNAGKILDQLRVKVKKSLRQTGEEGHSKDGMDMTLCIIDNKNRTVEYAGAYNPLFIYRNDELIEFKATRNPIGIYIKEKPFESNHIELQKDDVLYTFSDGFVDQFGGEDNRKFKTKNFKKLLLELYKRPLEEQKTILNQTIEDWRGDYEQTDDIIVFGVRIS